MRKTQNEEKYKVYNGTWIYVNEEAKWHDTIISKCPICGETFYDLGVDTDDGYMLYDYCPNCGAKLDWRPRKKEEELIY